MSRSDLNHAEWTDASAGPLESVREKAHDVWDRVAGPGGWKSVAGPAAFATGSIALLVYDHLHQKVPQIVFWLALMLIVTVFVWMIQTSHRQHGVLEEHERNARNDGVTGLHNRLQLEADIEEALAVTGDRRVLILLDVDGLQTYNDRFGYAAGDELVRRAAHALIGAVAPLGGTSYRIDANRLAVLVPAGDSELGEVVLSATASLRDEGKDLLIGRSYGEVAIPEEATDAEVAMQVAGQRLTAHNQRQHRSARRQAHAVLMAVLSSRRPELREHLRVGAYRAISLGRRLGLRREEMDDIALAAELQDVGLLAVPEAILEKNTRLTDEEAELIRSRPVAGERIIASAPGLAPVAALVRASAERYDGSGFPDGLAGEAIPLGSRIIAVAVAFAAMTAARPYRDAGSVEEALAELRRCAGTQFDPHVVEALAAELAEEAAPLAAA
jgi:two-component system, cell cycle response regulator